MHASLSAASLLASNKTTSEIQAFIEGLTDDELLALAHDWEFWARPNQLPPDGNWFGWLILAGRGFGKTRTGAEWVIERARQGHGPIALIGETAGDVRKVMVEGEGAGSAILECAPPDFRPIYNPSKRRLTFPNGVRATTFSGDKPDLLRGPQHATVWADEPAKWRYLEDAWDNMLFGLRIGDDPRWLATTTPRPIKLIRQWVMDAAVAVVRGSSYDNRANLAEVFFQRVILAKEGTRIGRQEIHAELLEEAQGALWQRGWLDRDRAKEAPEELDRVVVAVDPPSKSGENSDECGIVVAGRAGGKRDGRAFVLADGSEQGLTPAQWAKKAVALFYAHMADAIIAETNNGGEMVKETLRHVDAGVPVIEVWASRGKVTRAEPVSTLYEQGRVSHVGSLPSLEDQMCLFTNDFDPKQAGFSPDRVDALVWALTDLMLGGGGTPRARAL